MKLKRILLDMDGVLVNFVDAALTVHNIKPIENWTPGVEDVCDLVPMSKNDFWGKIDKTSHEFWANIPKYPWTDDLIKIVKKSNIPFTIATKPSRNMFSASGKIECLRRLFGKKFNDFMIGGQKYLMANPETLLVDDWTPNMKPFIDAGGQFYLFPQPWNKGNIDDRLTGLERILKNES